MRLAALLLLCTGCIAQKIDPPPAAPIALDPRVMTAGNVVLDVTGQVHAKVFAEQPDGLIELCTTPCAFTLQPGKYTLRFKDPKDAHRTSTADIEVPKTGRILVRHALGFERRLPTGVGYGGLLLGGVGLVSALIGGATLAGGGSTAKSANDNRAVGGVMLGVGALMFAGAWLMLGLYRGERQDGATTITSL